MGLFDKLLGGKKEVHEEKSAGAENDLSTLYLERAGKSPGERLILDLKEGRYAAMSKKNGMKITEFFDAVFTGKKDKVKIEDVIYHSMSNPTGLDKFGVEDISGVGYGILDNLDAAVMKKSIELNMALLNKIKEQGIKKSIMDRLDQIISGQDKEEWASFELTKIIDGVVKIKKR